MNTQLPNCPNCGAAFQPGREQVCQYCGTKLMSENPHVPPPPTVINFQQTPQKSSAGKGCLVSLIVVVTIIVIIIISFTYTVRNAAEKINEEMINNDTLSEIIAIIDETPLVETPFEQAESSTPSSKAQAVSSAPNAVSSKAPQKQISLTMPKTPVTAKYTITVSSATVITETTINSIKWERQEPRYSDGENDVRVKLTFDCKKISDWRGEQGTSAVNFRVIIKNSSGEIIETENLFKSPVSVNQICTVDCDVLLAAGGSYTVEIADYVS